MAFFPVFGMGNATLNETFTLARILKSPYLTSHIPQAMNTTQTAVFLRPSKMHSNGFTCMHERSRCQRRMAGFSLIELLSVMAVVGILMTAVVPAIGNMASASRRTKYLNEVSSLFEGARQYAVSKNTYVWVAFSADAAGGTPLYACVVASKNGLAQGYGPDDVWNSQVIDVRNSASFIPVTRVLNLGDFRLDPVDSLGSTAQFKIAAGGNKEVNFPRSVQFTPSGEAKVMNGVQGRIAFETSATEGAMKKVKDTFALNGPTGFLQFTSER